MLPLFIPVYLWLKHLDEFPLWLTCGISSIYFLVAITTVFICYYNKNKKKRG